MPNYDWSCEHCGHDFEQQADANTKSVLCPKCTSMAVRMPAAPNFTIKGFNAGNGYSK